MVDIEARSRGCDRPAIQEERWGRSAVIVLLCGGLVIPVSSAAQDLEIDHFPMLKERPVDGALTTTTTPLAPLDETFELHSHPGSSRVIYLDFDGHTTGGFVYDAWNMEGDDTDFSDTERTIIQLAWQSISEDFLPFDVDVTTEFPGIEALRKTGQGDEEWGIRAVINHSTYGYSWAYTGSFSDAEDVELFVWSGPYGAIYETWVWIADSVSHETGHSLGLSHDGTTTGIEYYEGHGSGVTAWSPIMGWTNFGLSQWSIGEYTDANNQEDDFEVIAQNGVDFRPDDHGATMALATPVDISTLFVADGIIEQPTDVDAFAFTVAADTDVFLRISPDNLAPNLDILATLSDADGVVLHTSNPPDALWAEFNVTLPAGDYALSVDGVGYDDPDSDGYSDYATLGYYLIESFSEGDFLDLDGDGFSAADGDCDDGDPDIGPGAEEICDGQGIDEDCDTRVDDKDSDCRSGATLVKGEGACGCSTAPSPWFAWPAFLVLWARRRSRSTGTDV